MSEIDIKRDLNDIYRLYNCDETKEQLEKKSEERSERKIDWKRDLKDIEKIYGAEA